MRIKRIHRPGSDVATLAAAALAATTLAAAALAAPAAAEPWGAAGTAPARTAAATPISNGSGTSASGVTFTQATVVIPAATVAAHLRSVSADGATYRFDSASGPLAQLTKGSVMLLSGYAVRTVTAVTGAGGGLTVRTRAAALTDLIENGTLSWNRPTSFTHAYAYSGSSVAPEPARDQPARGARAAQARPSVASRFGLAALDGHPITLKGSTRSYSYQMTFRPGAKSVGIDITISKSRPVDLSATISGTLDTSGTSGSIGVTKGHLSSARLVAKGIAGEFKLSYSVKPISQFGLGSAGGIKITLPGEITVPFAVGGIPFFIGVKVAFTASVGFSGFNQAVKGDYTIRYNGNGGFSTSSSGATSASGAIKGLGDILLSAANAVRTGPLSVIFGAQVPQLELGLGVKGLNVGGFVNVIAVTGMQTYGSGCDARGLQVQGNAGAEASFFGFSAPLGSSTLFTRQFKTSYPRGCGSFNGF